MKHLQLETYIYRDFKIFQSSSDTIRTIELKNQKGLEVKFVEHIRMQEMHNNF
jgi:hypothetical protein